MNEGKLTTLTDIRRFLLGGRAVFTLRNPESGTRFTYRVGKAKNTEGLWFVGLLAGADNENDYAYMGTLQQSGELVFSRTAKSRVGEDAPSWRGMAWLVRRLNRGEFDPRIEVWHEGRCCRCGRALTVPESVAAGIGPECATKGGWAA